MQTSWKNVQHRLDGCLTVRRALPTTGGCPWLLVRFDDAAKRSYHPQWATDGGRFYFTINDRQSNSYLAELHGLR